MVFLQTVQVYHYVITHKMKLYQNSIQLPFYNYNRMNASNSEVVAMALLTSANNTAPDLFALCTVVNSTLSRLVKCIYHFPLKYDIMKVYILHIVKSAQLMVSLASFSCLFFSVFCCAYFFFIGCLSRQKWSLLRPFLSYVHSLTVEHHNLLWCFLTWYNFTCYHYSSPPTAMAHKVFAIETDRKKVFYHGLGTILTLNTNNSNY